MKPHVRLLPPPRVRAEAEAATDDAIWLGALRAGRLDAVAWAYDRWHQRVRVLARRLLFDDASAEDVVQETFAALPAAAARFRAEVALERFVLGIAVKKARTHQRTAIRRRRALRELDTPPPAGPRDPEQDLYRRQLATRLEAALDRLPLKRRIAFVLCEVEGLTAGEAAAVAGAPEATLRTRLFHARRQLRDLLAEERGQ